ncbi:allophanate hydrolase subunit 1 [Saccharopolyspora erythraea]|uniref:5-oxoprolinase subunit B family protein n=1 Tax=Saccharopolyspora erythraea TaxID=1836 RepID=UPI001BA96C3F|nr:carboxyltransferase domain-containing protein [Saccharopolyspora erythraea]QUH02274.1 allophanate hydrolase subunit 1 [Saccharopolyspora erythraea]
MGHRVTISDCGDSAVVVKAVHGDANLRWQVVHNLADVLEEARLAGVHGLVPTYDSLLVEFDCTDTDHQAVRRGLADALARLAEGPVERASKLFVVPVVYGGEHGPDLPEVAAQLGLTEQKVIELHSGTALTVRCLGAPVGAPMMDGPPFPAPVARLASPRTSVPPGSVAVAGKQAVICPLRSPGGWPLLGRTPLRVLDLGSERLTPYRPGDRFRFVPIRPEQWDEHAGAPLAAVDG